jgi:hypothetical protein
MKRTFLLALALAATGCIHTPVAMMTSTKPLAPDGYDVVRPGSATDCKWMLFGFIPVTTGNTLQGAMQKAINDGGGDALIQVTADTFFDYWIVVSRNCTLVEGVGVRSKSSPSR